MSPEWVFLFLCFFVLLPIGMVALIVHDVRAAYRRWKERRYD